MRRFILLLAFVCLASQAEAPSAIFTDPPRDTAHPMHNEAVWIPSGGVSMNGVMYAAAGAQPHPTAVIVHGLPGNEQNLDLAQTLRRAGYNVLSFHFRGSWGSPGNFTLANGVEDGQASIAFLEDAANVAKFHIDPKRIILIGHSFGGFIAARVAAAHPKIAAVVLIAPWSPAEDVPFLKVAPDKFAATAHRAFDDVEGRLGGYTDVQLAKEIMAPGYDWHLESSAPAIKNMPILIMVAKHDSPALRRVP
jgi:pimeloyl-ACP methyl ester carboxylesterase